MQTLEGLAIVTTSSDIYTTLRIYTVTHSANMNAYSVVGTNPISRAVEDTFVTSDIRKLHNDIDGASSGYVVHWIMRPRIFNA